MGTSAVHVERDPGSRSPRSDHAHRRKAVEARLAAIGDPPAVRRTPPPEGRLGADDYPIRRVRDALVDLGPVFAGFGRYLASRVDLIPRRDTIELASIPDRGTAMVMATLEAAVARQLGAPIDRRFVGFNRDPFEVALWAQRHHAWIAPGVPVVVLVVPPDAGARLAGDLPLLALLQAWFDVPSAAFLSAVDDYGSTLRRRLDQTHQAASLATLAADASAGGRFAAPVCYRDHSAAGLLTLERTAGIALDAVMQAGPQDAPVGESSGDGDYARRIASAWLHQALAGRVVPFDFGPHDIVIDGDRLMLTGGAFEPHASGDRARFLSYINAVAADDPDAAAAWILDAASDGGGRHEEELRRRLRQAVPFRDGEWSGDDRFAEQLLVQWRMAREAGWPLTPHRLHLYRGLRAVAALAATLAPDDDVLMSALQDERIQMGLVEARRMMDPATVASTLDRLLQEMVHLPQRVDDVLTMAAEGRLRVKLQVPEGEAGHQTRNRTVLLVALLVALTGLASIVRQLAPAFGVGFERLGAVALLVLGGWLLVVAARM